MFLRGFSLVGDTIVGIDIGASKVCTIIGRMDRANQIDIIGSGISPCNGVKKGIIVDIEATANSIKESINQAESMSGVKVNSAYANIMGSHVNVVNNRAGITISNENKEITSRDVERVLNAVREIAVPDDRQIIDIIVKQYIIDDYDEIIDPIGMVGVRLEVEADIVIAKITSVQNIVKSFERANLRINGLIIQALATSEVLLAQDEKEMGVLMIDVGAGVTDVSVFRKNNLIFYDSIPVGGDHITNDISIGLKVSFGEAEKIKKQYNLALTSLIKNDQDISINDTNRVNKKSIKVSEAVEIIEARVYEMFSLCKEMLQNAGIDMNLSAGTVLTGGGISRLDGCIQLAGEVFELPVRIAENKVAGISKDEYVTSAGMIKYIFSNKKGLSAEAEVVAAMNRTPQKKKKNKLLEKLSKFFSDFF